MNTDSESSICKLLVRIRLDESELFNENYKKVLEDKARLRRVLGSTCSQIRNQRKLPGPTGAQKVNFRLAPLLDVQEERGLNTSVADANTWTATGKFGQLPNFPLRTSTRQTWLKLMSKLDTIGGHTSPVSQHSPVQTPSMRSDSESYPGTPSLPVFKMRAPTKTFLIRRPTVERPIPLKTDEELFEVLVKSFELKALPFKKTSESYKFYETHFPLLLTRITNSERCSTPNRRSRTPESPMSIMINRKRQMNERIVELEFMMNVMEKETDPDCQFVTELHSPLFDPTTWPWNKLNVSGLTRRYTIEASLKEM